MFTLSMAHKIGGLCFCWSLVGGGGGAGGWVVKKKTKEKLWHLFSNKHFY